MQIGGMKVAPVGRRILGGLADLMWSLVVIYLVGKIFGASSASVNNGSVNASVKGYPALIGCLLVFTVIALMEANGGKTPAKYFLKMRVVNENGLAITTKQAFIRNYLRFIDGISFYLIGIIALLVDSDKNQRLGDRVAKTYVVQEN